MGPTGPISFCIIRFMKKTTVFLSLLSLLVSTAACTNEQGNISLRELPEVSVLVDNVVIEDYDVVYVEQITQSLNVTIENTSQSSDITIYGVRAGAGLSFENEPTYPFQIHNGEQFHYVVNISDEFVRSTLTFSTSMTQSGSSRSILFERAQAKPSIITSPQYIDYGLVTPGTRSRREIYVLNVGNAELEISSANIHDSDRYYIDPISYPVSVSRGNYVSLWVTFTPSDTTINQATLTLMTNDEHYRSGYDVDLIGNARSSCLLIRPSQLDFGVIRVGEASTLQIEIESCGDVATKFNRIAIESDNTDSYTMDPEQNFVLQPHATLTIDVTFSPTEASQIDAEGDLVSLNGTLQITSDASQTIQAVDLIGYSAPNSCPIAVITTLSEEVIPQTVIRLTAQNSLEFSGEDIVRWEWNVTQPIGSMSLFSPSQYVESPNFEANVVGEYIFSLRVWDAYGNVSCVDAVKKVIVTTDEAIRVELLWNTPGDLNQSDAGILWNGASVGSDVDLHFLKDPTEYFNLFYDCFWKNTVPDWGRIMNTTDNPRLDRDDTDGAGPENLNLSVPEDDSTYRVGVHYWNDWGFGKSWVTLRIYVYGSLIDEWAGVELHFDDMWDAYMISWPDAAVTRIGPGPKIFQNYVRP